MADSVNVPKPGEWPGVFEAFKTVRPFVKPRIWDFLSVIGIGIAGIIVVRIIFTIIFKSVITSTVITDILSIFIGAFLQASLISMFFAALKGEDFSVNGALNYGLNNLLKMAWLLIVMYVVLAASFILLIIPFLFVLPRVYLAPYFLVKDNLPVSEALSASWNSTKGNVKWVWGVILLNIAIGLLFITIIGIPFAVYWGVINSGTYALLTLYLSQPTSVKAKAAKT